MTSRSFASRLPALHDPNLELRFYERFFIERGLEPFVVQEEAITKIFAGQDVLVTVPTGTGKTLMAKAGIFLALETGRSAIYTTPLRALTEEKYRELCDDFGPENVGFATGDYRTNPGAPIQVLVAEILWNRIYTDRAHAPADIVIMDEGHYFNDPERGYVWETSIIGLDPRSQLVILSATVGYPESFCQWAYVTRNVPMALVKSSERKVPLLHEFREAYLVDTVKELAANDEVPAIVFAFSRKGCYEWARLLRSCPRFVTDDERRAIEERAAPVLFSSGFGAELGPLLLHGVGIHHAGILPRYRRLIEELTLDRLLKFVVSTETISAGINLPAKRVIFPSLRKFVRGEARLLRPAEYHQMAGRAGRPQFDKEGLAITLAPEEVVQEFRKEIRDQKRSGLTPDEEKIKKRAYMRAKNEARAKNDVIWDREAFSKIVEGAPAALVSQTKITAEQILAIGLPDLVVVQLPGEGMLRQSDEIQDDKGPNDGPSESAVKVAGSTAVERTDAKTMIDRAAQEATSGAGENIKTVIDHLALNEAERRAAHKRLAMITANLRALGVLDEHGQQVRGDIIGKIRGLDGVFVYYVLMHADLSVDAASELIEYLVDHDIIQKHLNREADEKKRQWCLLRLRELRRESPQATFEDAEAEYEKEFPRALSPTEVLHQDFSRTIPHPELHGGKIYKDVLKRFFEHELDFEGFVEKFDLAKEEGSLFTYLARIMKAGRMLRDATGLGVFEPVEAMARQLLAPIDSRVLNEWDG